MTDKYSNYDTVAEIAHEAQSRHPHSWTQPATLRNGYGPVVYKDWIG